MKRWIVAASAAIALMTPSVGATQGAASNMSLHDAMAEVKRAILSQGVVAWQGSVHAGDSGENWTYTRSVETTNITLNESVCILSFHYKVITNGEVSVDIDAGIPFGEVESLEATTEAALVQRRDARAGHGSWVSTLTPQIYDIDLVRGDGTENVISFYSSDMANQAIDAIERARQLCRHG
jgi:hypothetical protein